MEKTLGIFHLSFSIFHLSFVARADEGKTLVDGQ
jgi:hypothetical protein